MARSWAARLWPAATFQFCFIAAVALLKPGANALVLSRFQAGVLPWLYMGAAAIAGAFAVWSAWRGGRRPRPALWALLGAATALLLAAGVWAELPLVSIGAYLFAEAFATQVSLSFWGAVGDAFDAREARRAFTWVNGLGMTGAIFGGFLAQELARAAGAGTLLMGAAALLVGAAVAFRFHRSELEAQPRGPRGTRGSWAWVRSSPYARLLAGVVLGFSFLSVLVDWLFRERAVTHLAESEMAALFGSNQLWTGVFCVVFQLVAAEVLLRRLGILRYVALIPLGLGALAGVSWAWHEVWGAWTLKLLESAASWSLLPVAYQLLYAPLPDESRDSVRRTIDGLLRKAAVGGAGLVLLGLAGAAGLPGVSMLVLALSGGLVWLLWRMRAHYVEAVHARVAGVQPEAIADSEERLLTEALKSPSHERALRAADLLDHAGLVKEHHVRLLLAHAHERAQERAVHLVEKLSLSTLSRPLEVMIVTAERRPRDAAVWALARLAPDRAREVLPPLLGTADVGLLCTAVGGLLSLPGTREPRATQALETLLKRGSRAPAAERREVARLLGRLADPAMGAPLQRYLEDGEASVRKVAIGAVGEGRYVELAPRLLRFLSWRDDRRAARDALARLGDAVVPLLAATLDDRTRALTLRTQLPRVLRSVGTQAAFDALLFSNAQDDPGLHYRVGVAVARLHEEAPQLRVDREQVLAALGRRGGVYRQLVEPFRDLRAALGDAALLTRVVGDRLDQSLELTFWLLGLLHEGRTLRRAHAHLVGADSRRRAWAMELLESTLPPEELEVVKAPLERHHRAQEPGQAHLLVTHLEALCTSADYVLRACARQVGRHAGVWTHPLREDDMSDVTLKRLFALEGVEVFAQSDVDDLAAVAAVAKEHSFRAGERVYSEGDPGDALYVVVEGALEARREGELVMTMRAKESFGETSLFDGAPRVNEVVAIAPTRCLVIDRRDFLDLLGDRPELLTGMFRMLSRQLKSMVVDLHARRHTTGEMPALGDGKGPR